MDPCQSQIPVKRNMSFSNDWYKKNIKNKRTMEYCELRGREDRVWGGLQGRQWAEVWESTNELVPYITLDKSLGVNFAYKLFITHLHTNFLSLIIMKEFSFMSSSTFLIASIEFTLPSSFSLLAKNSHSLLNSGFIWERDNWEI